MNVKNGNATGRASNCPSAHVGGPQRCLNKLTQSYARLLALLNKIKKNLHSLCCQTPPQLHPVTSRCHARTSSRCCHLAPPLAPARNAWLSIPVSRSILRRVVRFYHLLPHPHRHPHTHSHPPTLSQPARAAPMGYVSSAVARGARVAHDVGGGPGDG